MPEYQLHCFAQSGNSYRAALMLNLIGADWEPVWVDFFKAGVQRSPEFRSEINEMGELPVLVHGKKTLTQSGVILTYLANRTGKFKPQGAVLHAPISGLNFLPTPNPVALEFLKGRFDNTLGIVNKRLEKSPFLVGERPTIADISMTGYFYYPAEEFGFDIDKDYPAIGAWKARIKALPGWAHPNDLMPAKP